MNTRSCVNKKRVNAFAGNKILFKLNKTTYPIVLECTLLTSTNFEILPGPLPKGRRSMPVWQKIPVNPVGGSANQLAS